MKKKNRQGFASVSKSRNMKLLIQLSLHFAAEVISHTMVSEHFTEDLTNWAGPCDTPRTRGTIM